MIKINPPEDAGDLIGFDTTHGGRFRLCGGTRTIRIVDALTGTVSNSSSRLTFIHTGRHVVCVRAGAAGVDLVDMVTGEVSPIPEDLQGGLLSTHNGTHLFVSNGARAAVVFTVDARPAVVYVPETFAADSVLTHVVAGQPVALHVPSGRYVRVARDGPAGGGGVARPGPLAPGPRRPLRGGGLPAGPHAPRRRGGAALPVLEGPRPALGGRGPLPGGGGPAEEEESRGGPARRAGGRPSPQAVRKLPVREGRAAPPPPHRGGEPASGGGPEGLGRGAPLALRGRRAPPGGRPGGPGPPGGSAGGVRRPARELLTLCAPHTCPEMLEVVTLALAAAVAGALLALYVWKHRTDYRYVAADVDANGPKPPAGEANTYKCPNTLVPGGPCILHQDKAAAACSANPACVGYLVSNTRDPVKAPIKPGYAVLSNVVPTRLRDGLVFYEKQAPSYI